MKKIRLSQGKVAFVDDEDYPSLSQKRWCAAFDRGIFYAVRTIQVDGKCRTIKMHREVLGLQHKDGIMCDHRDRDGLNNQKYNLRVCSNSQNQRNSKKTRAAHSRYKGVSFFRRKHLKRPWTAVITNHRTHIYLGVFQEESNAARAYDEAARRLFGRFRRNNGII